uniref:Uncharacterized protein n=1 Tax=Tanacetum cinerariifolium TaxID=118510 RepID=A0A6L2NTU4_TANCI|nr:hypothetical protein [Tanacetum cinerariifolium]
MIDYFLWEVIKNGNKVLMKMVRPVEQPYEPTTLEEKLDRKNEMKAKRTLLMALPNKDQLKFHSYQDAKLLMKAIEKSQANSPQLAREDLEQIDPGDLEEMDLKALKNQVNKGRAYGRQIVPVKNPTEKPLIAQYGIGGYDWSIQAEEEHPTNFALMALVTDIKKGQNPSKTEQNRAQNRKRGKVKSQPKSTPTKLNPQNQKVKRNKG